MSKPKSPWWEEALRGRKTGLLAASLRRAAEWGSLGYQAGLKGRAVAYKKGWLAVKKLPRPTICVGNITVGGTGKTPLVIRLVSDLMARGLRPAVLLRGYKRERPVRLPVIVRDAHTIFAGVRESGDEAMELAVRLPGACVGVGANRYAVGQVLLKQAPVDCFILDDGFQHVQLDRDMNIVAMDVTDPWGGGKLLPAGLLRETPEALQRADWVVLTRTGLIAPDRLSVLRAEVAALMRPPAQILESEHQPRSVVAFTSHNELPLTSLQGKKVIAVSGIGSPESFEANLVRLGAEVVDRKHFPDHGGRLREVWAWVKAHRKPGQWVLMTEKDAMRWTARVIPPAMQEETYVLRMDLVVTSGESLWKDLLEQVYRSVRHA